MQAVSLDGGQGGTPYLLCGAKGLTLGTKHVSIDDLADAEVITPQMFEILCNAIAIRRFGIDAIHYQGRREKRGW